MGLISNLMANSGPVLVTLVVSIIGKLLGEEIKAWLPKITNNIVNLAVANLPNELKERYSEEWAGYIQEVPGDLSKVLQAFSLIVASWQISAEYSPARKMFRFGPVPAFFLFVYFLPAFVLIGFLISLDGGPVLVREQEIKIIDGKFQKKSKLRFRTVSNWPNSYGRLNLFGDFLMKTSLNDYPILLDIMAGKEVLYVDFNTILDLFLVDRDSNRLK